MRRDKKIVVLFLGIFLAFSTATFSVNTVVAEEDGLELKNLSVEDIEAGEEAVIEVEVVNNGEERDSDYVDLFINGDYVEYERVSLGEGESEKVTFTEEKTEIGDYSVKVELALHGDSETDEFTVEYGTVDEVELFLEDDPETDEKTITAGETIQFTAKAYDTDVDDYENNPITDDPNEFKWEYADEQGYFEKTEAGTYEVTASLEDVTSETIEITVEPSDPAQIVFKERPNEDVYGEEDNKLVAEEVGEYTIQVQDNNGNPQSEGEFKIELEVNGDGLHSSTLSDEDHTGVIEWSTTRETGEYDIRAVDENDELEAAEDTISVVKVDSVEIDQSDDDVTLELGDEKDFSATAYDEDDEQIQHLDDTDFEWNTADADGFFDPSGTGEYNVQAIYEYGTTSIYNNVESSSLSVTVEEDQGEDDDEEDSLQSTILYVIPITIIITVVMVFVSIELHYKRKDDIKDFYKGKKRPSEWTKEAEPEETD